VTWRFRSATRHNVTFASGPRAIGTATLARGAQASLRLVEPGRYQLFCYLHPVTMHQVIDVGAVALRR
jgi:plastocyanin